jgi:hypothetical protein
MPLNRAPPRRRWMEVRFHLEEDAEDHALIVALRERGLDLTTTAEAHLTRSDDEFQLNWAAQARRVLVTHKAATLAGFIRLGWRTTAIIQESSFCSSSGSPSVK